MRINSSSSSLTAMLTMVRHKKVKNFSVPEGTRAAGIGEIIEQNIKVKLYDNKYGMTNFKYNIKEFISMDMNFTQRL